MRAMAATVALVWVGFAVGYHYGYRDGEYGVRGDRARARR